MHFCKETIHHITQPNTEDINVSRRVKKQYIGEENRLSTSSAHG